MDLQLKDEQKSKFLRVQDRENFGVQYKQVFSTITDEMQLIGVVS